MNRSLMGRAGNDLASALVKILEMVFSENKELKNLVLWSDSCVPQNLNSLISYAIAYFFTNEPPKPIVNYEIFDSGTFVCPGDRFCTQLHWEGFS